MPAQFFLFCQMTRQAIVHTAFGAARINIKTGRKLERSQPAYLYGDDLMDVYKKLVSLWLLQIRLILFDIGVNDLAFHTAAVSQIDDHVNIVFPVYDVTFNNRIIDDNF